MNRYREQVDSGTLAPDAVDQLLLYLRTKEHVPIPRVLTKFKLAPEQLELLLQEIRNWGYKLKTGSRQITFVSAPDLLTSTEISYRLKTRLIGKHVYSYRLVRSTNDLVAQLAETGAPEGLIVTAEQQNQGRGRLGRSWFSPEGTGIYVSILLRPRLKPEQAPGLSIMTALALADTLASYVPGEVSIKWPNDILLSGKKVCGILTELSAEKNKIHHVVVGVGINVNQKAADFPPDIRRIATSLRVSVKRHTDRAELLRNFLLRFESEYLAYQKFGLKRARRRIRNRVTMLGKTVRLRSGESLIEGTAVDIDLTGALILRQGDKQITVSAGEVTVVKE